MMTKHEIVTGVKFNYNMASQAEYSRDIRKLVNQMVQEVSTKIVELFKSQSAKNFYLNQKQLAMDDTLSSQANILTNELLKKFNLLFTTRAKEIATRMVDKQNKQSSVTMNENLKKLSGGLSISGNLISPELEEIGASLIAANVSLIKSIPQEYLTDVTGAVMRSISAGKGLADLVPELKKYTGIVDKRAKEIAYDQTRKAYTSINRQKMLDRGLNKFKWLHSGGGQTPRETHLHKLDGNIFSLDATELEKEQVALGLPPKDRGFPGFPVNCRCTMLSVLTFEKE